MRKLNVAATSRYGRLAGGAAVLAAGSVLAKIIGAFYRIPLTNILGAEGMGMYQLVFPVYALFITLSTAGIPTALSRIVAEHRARGENAKKYLAAALFTLLSLSALAGILMTALSRLIAGWQGNPEAAGGFLAVAPAVFFVGIVAGLRGWFQGEMYMLPTALAGIIEQTVKLGVGVGLAVALAPRGAAVEGALIGVTVSEFSAALYLAVTYRVRSRKRGDTRASVRLDAEERKAMFRTAAPIALLGLILPLGAFADSMVVVNALKWGGESTSSATAMYGLYSGPVTSLVNLPVVVVMSLAIAVVPSLSVSRSERDVESIMQKSRMSLKLVYLIGVPCALFFAVFCREMLSVMYPALSDEELATASRLLLIASLGVPPTAASQIYVSLLQALDKTYSAIKSMLFAIIVKLILSLALIPSIGVTGAATAGVVMSVCSLFTLAFAFHRLTGLRIEKNVAKTMLAGVIMALTALVVRQYVPVPLGALIAGAVVCASVYGWLVSLMGVFTEAEVLSLPFGSRLAAIRRKIRFWEKGYDG